MREAICRAKDRKPRVDFDYMAHCSADFAAEKKRLIRNLRRSQQREGAHSAARVGEPRLPKSSKKSSSQHLRPSSVRTTDFTLPTGS